MGKTKIGEIQKFNEHSFNSLELVVSKIVSLSMGSLNDKDGQPTEDGIHIITNRSQCDVQPTKKFKCGEELPSQNKTNKSSQSVFSNVSTMPLSVTRETQNTQNTGAVKVGSKRKREEVTTQVVLRVNTGSSKDTDELSGDETDSHLEIISKLRTQVFSPIDDSLTYASTKSKFNPPNGNNDYSNVIECEVESTQSTILDEIIGVKTRNLEFPFGGNRPTPPEPRKNETTDDDVTEIDKIEDDDSEIFNQSYRSSIIDLPNIVDESPDSTILDEDEHLNPAPVMPAYRKGPIKKLPLSDISSSVILDEDVKPIRVSEPVSTFLHGDDEVVKNPQLPKLPTLEEENEREPNEGKLEETYDINVPNDIFIRPRTPPRFEFRYTTDENVEYLCHMSPESLTSTTHGIDHFSQIVTQNPAGNDDIDFTPLSLDYQFQSVQNDSDSMILDGSDNVPTEFFGEPDDGGQDLVPNDEVYGEIGEENVEMLDKEDVPVIPNLPAEEIEEQPQQDEMVIDTPRPKRNVQVGERFHERGDISLKDVFSQDLQYFEKSHVEQTPKKPRVYTERYVEDPVDVQPSNAQLCELVQNSRNELERMPMQEPVDMTCTLYDFQKQALFWMIEKEKTSKGGIVADEMGLGKTVEMISLLMFNKKHPSAKKKGKPILIIAPLSIQGQWIQELKSKCNVNLRIYNFLGPKRSRNRQFLKKKDVIISSYETIQREVSSNSPILKMRFSRLILDEAHKIKNLNTKKSQAILKLSKRCRKRWLLTGTPIHNKVLDLFGYLKILKFSPYDNLTLFKSKIIGTYKKNPEKGIELIRAVVSSVMLRRKKSTRIFGRPLFELAPKIILIHHCQFNDDEKSLYDIVKKKAKVTMSRLLRNAGSLKGSKNIMTLILRLRQLCNHHKMIMKKEDWNQMGLVGADDPDADYMDVSTDDGNTTEAQRDEFVINLFTQKGGKGKKMFVHSTKTLMIVRKIKEIMNDERFKNDKIIVFSFYLEFIKILKVPLNHEKINFVEHHGSISGPKRALEIERLKKSRNIKVILATTGATGLGINLTCCNHAIFAEPDWNPCNEFQCMDRVHRLGQKKQVYIHRFVIDGTVEEKVIEIQEKKKKMILGALGDIKKPNLNINDFKEIFGIN